MQLPQQKTTYKQKTAKRYADDGRSYRTDVMDTADHYIDQAGLDSVTAEIEQIQNAVEGIIDTAEYQHLLNPFGLSDMPNNIKVGAQLRNHNILKGIVNLLMGEYGRRTHDFTVTDFNGEDENQYKEGLAEALSSYYEQEAINALNGQGMETGQPSVEQGTPQQAEERYKQSFESYRVIRGQDAIDYIKYDQEVDDKFMDIYYDWITTGIAYSYKCVRKGDVIYEEVPSRQLYVPNVQGLRFVEDAPFAVRKWTMPINNILDAYNEHLDEEDIDYLTSTYVTESDMFAGASHMNVPKGGFIKLPTLDSNCGNASGFGATRADSNGIPMAHVQYRSFKKVGTLIYTSPLGEVEEMEVSDDYKMNKELGDISITWKWESVIWEVTRIADRVYCLARELPENRAMLNNKGVQMLSYNGPINRTKSGQIISIVKDGFPYQILTNIIHYQMEKLINKNKDKLTVMPYGLVPRKKGIDTTQQMHHADASSILWVDETAPNASYAAQMIKVLDMSLGNYINDLMQILAFIKQEYWDTIGMNAQRYSDVAQGAGKAVTEQAIVRSAVITYELTRKMDKFIQREYTGFLDISKLAWIDGVKGKYVLSDGTKAFLEMNPDDAVYHLESDYGVFVRDSAELTDSLNQFKQLAGAYAQQTGSMSATAEVFSNNNMEKIKLIIGKIEDATKKHEAELASINGEKQKELQAMVDENDSQNRELKKYEIDMEYQGQVDSAEIRTGNNSRNEARPANDVELALASHKMEKDNNKERQEDKRLAQKDMELSLKNKAIDRQAQKSTTN